MPRRIELPLWGDFYCGLFLVSCCFSLFDKDRLKKPYQPAGEILDFICGILIFLIAFSVLHFQQAPLISFLCFIYTFVWSYHAHRHYLNFESFKADIHKSSIEEHEKLINELTEINNAAIAEGVAPEELEKIEENYDFEATEKEARYFYYGVIALLVVVLIPYFYVFLKSVGAIGN
ncbi:MAG: hypothetical protein ACI96N_003051 [Arenicella sp.]